ncbi:MAG: thioredoxin family protein [Fidelibacterota bacterium]
MNIKVEVFSSPGCSKCGHAKELLRNMALELGEYRVQWRDVNILNELDYAVKMGVLTTPAIAVNGELVFAGLPSAEKLKALLMNRLNAPDSTP